MPQYPIIHIRSLGPVRDSEITLAPLTVLTGESGVGKSYVALACFYIYEILSGARLTRFFKARGHNLSALWEQTPDDGTILTVKASELLEWLESDVIEFIGQMTGNPTLHGEIGFEFPRMSPDETFTFTRTRTEQQSDGKTSVFQQLSCGKTNFTFPEMRTHISDVMFAALLATNLCNLILSKDNNMMFDSLILPPSRGALMDCISRPTFKAGIYDRFYDLKERVISNQSRLKYEEDQVAATLARRAIEGELSVTDGEVYYTYEGAEEQLPLSATASSIKELASYLFLLQSPNAFASGILFEEPEAHLHPARQVLVADTFGYLLSRYSRLIITTHSDFLIKRINQLMSLYTLRRNHYQETKELLERMSIERKSLINPKSVNAYLLAKNDEGFTRITRMNTEDGIPFFSFDKVTEREFDLSDEIERIETLPENRNPISSHRAIDDPALPF